MPPATIGPGPLIDAPLAGTPFTVVNSPLVLNSHSTAPVSAAYARTPPSCAPVRTAPGIAVAAARIAGVHPRPRTPHVTSGGGVIHTRCPDTRSTACTSPACGPLP